MNRTPEQMWDALMEHLRITQPLKRTDKEEDLPAHKNFLGSALEYKKAFLRANQMPQFEMFDNPSSLDEDIEYFAAKYGGSQLRVAKEFNLAEVKRLVPTRHQSDKNLEVVYVATLDFPEHRPYQTPWCVAVCYRYTNPLWSKAARGIPETITKMGYFDTNQFVSAALKSAQR